MRALDYVLICILIVLFATDRWRFKLLTILLLVFALGGCWGR